MKTLNTALAGAAALLLATAPAALVHAQSDDSTAVNADAVITPHGDWTLKEREGWLSSRLDKARDDGSIDSAEFGRVHHDLAQIKDDEDQLRDTQQGQLTDNQTATLENRLDGVADQIHWLHENGFRRPW